LTTIEAVGTETQQGKVMRSGLWFGNAFLLAAGIGIGKRKTLVKFAGMDRHSGTCKDDAASPVDAVGTDTRRENPLVRYNGTLCGASNLLTLGFV